MNTKFVSNYTDEERAKCVEQYFKGYHKEQLAEIWGVSKRTIERWIKEYERINKIEIRIAKRSKVIPIDSQQEIMQIINRNAIIYGFNISTWNEAMVIMLLKDRYNIKITRYMARELLSDKNYFSDESEEKTLDELNEMEKLGYKLILLDYIRFGKINRRAIEALFYKKFKEHRLNVNLGIARGTETAYVGIIFSDIDIVEKNKKINLVKSLTNIKGDSKQRQVIAEDKYDFINKIISKESNGNKVVFITTEDSDIERFKNKNGKALFYMINKELYEQLIQDKYEKDDSNDVERYSLVQYLYNVNNEYKNYESFEKIRKDIAKKVKKYALELEPKMNNKENIVKSLEIRKKIIIF